MDTYTQAADAAVAEVCNVDPQEVYAWVRESNPELAGRVIRDAAAGRFSTAKEATGEYLAALDTIDPEACLNADLGPHARATMRKGQVVVKLGGQEYSWRQAMKFRKKK